MNPKIKKITLTGATGFIGSNILVALLRNGYLVNILGRSRNNIPIKERIKNLLNWYGYNDHFDNVKIFETDFNLPSLGLDVKDYSELCLDSPPILHCASDTSFAERNRDRVMESNVGGLEGILKLANDSKADYLHYISTAYAAGIVQGTVLEKLGSASEFTNVYEESKAIAEKEISRYCDDFSIPFTITRPSIVYGNSETGNALKFNALYYPVKSIQHIRDIYINDIMNNEGVKSAQHKIAFNDKGVLELPIKIYLSNEGFINLIPVNYFTDVIMKIIDRPVRGRIYHVTSDTPSDMKTLLKYIEKFLMINGLEAVYSAPEETTMRNPPEELFDHFIRPYLPYLSDRRIFERINTDDATGELKPPELSYEIFKKCMEFAISTGWGKNLNLF